MGRRSVEYCHVHVISRSLQVSNSMRFSLFNLFLAIAMAGVLCASVISKTGYWLAVLYTLTLLLFSVTGLRSMGLRQPQRAFAIAFAISAGMYLILTNCTTMFARTSLLTNYP